MMSADARDLSESHGHTVELSAVSTAGLSARLAPFNPVTPDVVDAVIDLVLPALGPADLFVDIGSGDGRLLLAVRQRQKCLVAGVELSADLHEKAEERKCGAPTHVRDGVFLYNADACAFDFKGALPRPPTVLFAYLVPEGFRLLASTLVELLLWMDASRSSGADRRSMLVTYMFSLPPSSSYCVIESATGSVDVLGVVLLHSKHTTSRGMPIHTYTLVGGARKREDSCCPRGTEIVLAPEVGGKASGCPRPEPVDPGCPGLA
jgi:SAM-dependent methyltransferase